MAVGPDDSHYEFLKQLNKTSISWLLQIYNGIWTSGKVPTLWKQTTVIPILKYTKDPNDHTSHF